MVGSEVARLLQQIREEEEAAQRALNGYAIVGRHEFIAKHMENMSLRVNALTQVVGSEEAAMDLIIADQMQQKDNTNNVAL